MDLNHPTITVALPIVITVAMATLAAIRSNNKAIDQVWKRIDDLGNNLGKRLDDLRSDMNARFAAVEKRLDKLEPKVEGILERSWR